MHSTRHFLISFATIGLTVLATGAHAVDYIESSYGDAGPLLATAGDTTFLTGPLDNIRGSLSNDVDLFKIYVNDFTQFRAATNFAGETNFNTQLFLFDSTGKGIAFNDNITTTNLFSNLAQGASQYVNRAPGFYYLGISASDYDPMSASGLIFGNALTGTRGANGPGSAGSLTGWTGSSNSAGNYRISLRGVGIGSAVGATPEPGAVATAIAFGGALGGLILRRRRKIS